MKKLVFGLIAIVLIANMSFGQNILNEETIGEIHNQQMDLYYTKIYNLLKEQKDQKIKKETFYELFDNQINDFWGSNNEKLVLDASNGFKQNLNLTLLESTNKKIDEIKNSKNISDKLKKFLLDLISESEKINSDQITAFYNEKKELATIQFESNDLKLALISINVGKSSQEYWNNNINKWNDLIKDATGTSQSLSKGTVGKADLVGVIAGGIWGGLGGTAVLPGVGTVTGAVAVGLTTGFYMSLVAAVKTLVDFFF